MEYSKKLVYPAFIKQHGAGDFGVYFPILFPKDGWEYPLTEGATKLEAINSAEKRLALSLAGILYDNEDLPEASITQSEHLSEGMEIVDIETTLNLKTFLLRAPFFVLSFPLNWIF